MKQIKIEELGVKELTGVELMDIDGGNMIGDSIGVLLNLLSKYLNPFITMVLDFFK